MKTIPTTILCCMASSLLIGPINAFTTVDPSRLASTPYYRRDASIAANVRRRRQSSSSTGSIVVATGSSTIPYPPLRTTTSSLHLDVASSTPDLSIVALVAGQENYGLGIVSLIEAIWSFVQSPSMSHARVLLPASIACFVLFVISGPMITSGDANTVALGLEISTVVSIMLGASYVARLLAPYSPSAKEAAFAGLLIAIAGFFSFSQNLVVDGFVALPTLPSLPLPEMPLGLGESIDTDRY